MLDSCLIKDKLKQCPFCGKRANLREMGSFGPVNSPSVVAYWYVGCNSRCGCYGPIRKSKAGAIKAWNRRPPVRVKFYECRYRKF